MSRRVFVTGGAGFIGSHLVDRLLAAGDRVAIVDDLSRGRREWVDGRAELHELDIRDAPSLRAAAADIEPEVVVHLAAMHFIPAVDGAPELAREVNVGGTRALLGALERRPPALLLFASTAAVYPDRRGPIDESCEPSPTDVYGQTKLEGERLVAEFAAACGARAVVARIFNVIGRRETNAHIVPELVGQLRDGAAAVSLGNLEPRRDYTDVVDVADALHRLVGTAPGTPQTFNLGSGRSVSVADLVRTCEEILERPIAVELDPERRRGTDRAELLANGTLLRETTGWQPTRTLRETLADLLAAPVGS